MSQTNLETATLGAGCFWCVEAIFQRLKGVESVLPGYSGGIIDNPTYSQVSNGITGHVEVAQLKFDPDIISFVEILEVFFYTHDPTQLDGQGNDIGEQYRSVIFYHDKKQKKEAEEVKEKLAKSGEFEKPIVTTIEKFDKFWVAEDYHKNYFENNPEAGYCRVIIKPKIQKFQEKFRDKLKN